jgi:hypothetical protein
VPKPPPNDDEFYTVEDFNVGEELNLYSRVFKITNCDQFTTNFLTKLGVRIGQREQVPEDPYSGVRKAVSRFVSNIFFLLSLKRNDYFNPMPLAFDEL